MTLRPETVRSDESFTLHLGGLDATDRLTVFLGRTDITDLFERGAGAWRYRVEELALPRGDQTVRVYRVDGGVWTLLAEETLRVSTPSGLLESSIEPAINLEASGDLSRDSEPEDLDAEDAQLEGRLAFAGTWERPRWTYGVEADVFAVTLEEKALRFFDDENAPQIDLARYRLFANDEHTEIEVGHTTYDANRFLIDGFSSRGLRAKRSFGGASGERFDAGFALLHSTQIVGWDEVLGISRSRNRLSSGRLGAELLSRPGGLRVDFTLFEGERLPDQNFSGSSVTDTETSEGWGVGLRSESAAGRLRLEASYARSDFDNPEDPLLAQGADLVAVESEERDARWARVEVDVLRDREVGGRSLNLGASAEHLRVEPLYASIGVTLQSDIERNAGSLTAGWGGWNADVRHAESVDNLDDIASILTTETDQSNATLRWAPVEWSRGWVPVVSYAFGRVHQEGQDVPVDSGFNETHVPDFVSTDHVASAELQGASWQLGYRFSATEQDNRQPGREFDDFETTIHSVFGQRALTAKIDLGLELSNERFESLGADAVDETDRVSLSLGWRPVERLSFQFDGSWTRLESRPDDSEDEDRRLDLLATWRLLETTWAGRALSGSLFVRAAWSENELLEPLFAVRDFRSDERLSAGLAVSWQ